MPRTLSGLKTGDFDTLEVADKFEAKGEMIHSGDTAPEFALLRIGGGTAEFAGNIKLIVNGDFSCSRLSTTGVEANLKIKRQSDGYIWTYNGGTDVPDTSAGQPEIVIPSIPDPHTLTINHGSSTVGTYDTNDDATVTIPTNILTIKHGTTLLGTFNNTAAAEVLIPKNTLTIKHGTSSVLGTYDTTSAEEVAVPQAQDLNFIHRDGGAISTYDPYSASTLNVKIPRTIVTSQHPDDEESTQVTSTSTILNSDFGLELTPTATSHYLIEVQMWVANTSSHSEDLTVTLTTSRTATGYSHAEQIVYIGKAVQHLVQYKKVLTLSAGTHQVGIAVNSETDYDGDNIYIKYGGDYPDLMMSATTVHTVASGTDPTSSSDDY